MKSRIKSLIDAALPEIASRYAVTLPSGFTYEIELPKSKEHGDLAANVALKLSRVVRRKPAEVAGEIKEILAGKIAGEPALAGSIKKMEVEGPGFLNFFLTHSVLHPILLEIQEKNALYGASGHGKGEKVLVEYVSANPTGPLTIAHGRQACIGDALARILKAAGYAVSREYYLNDTGRQIEILGRSAWLRYQEHFGLRVEFPEEGYQGDYIRDLARLAAAKIGDRYKSAPEKEAIAFFSDFAAAEIMNGIRKDLADLRVEFDCYYSEKKLRESGKIEETLDLLRGKGLVFEAEGAVWFKSTAFGDDKDRVVRKSTGEYTYLAPDIAYHQEKFRRGYEWLINLWGPDHHGYIPRMKAAVQALGGDKDSMDVLIVQLTTLFRQGQPVRMSTRAGEFVTLRELMDEVGVDATRMFFILRRVESLLDFDLDLAKAQSQENPVYYLQYAHARISSILAYGGVPVTLQVDLELLRENEEIDLMKHLQQYPDILIAAATGQEPYRVVDYLRDLATTFHKFYANHRVVTDNAELTRARLLLVDCVRIVLRNGLEVIGVSQPAKM
jgi:arginyl-tRNA synthetase